jgi:hypothetical protein
MTKEIIQKEPKIGDIVYWDYEEKNRQYYVVLELTDLGSARVIYLGGDIFFAQFANKPVNWSLFGFGTSWWVLEQQ